MYELIGLAMFVAQVWGAVILFGGHQNAPKRLKITIGVFLIAVMFALIGLASE